METPIDYQLLATFVAVVEETSFTKAATRLRVGKGTVSRAIAKLEALVGAELVHRTTHAVAPSIAGAALYERTAQHIGALDRALRKLPERDERPSGLLRVTAPNDFGLIVLPEVLAQFGRRYPEVRFEVKLTNTRVDLIAEGFDLAIRAGVGPPKESALTAHRLSVGGGGIYASPSYIARKGKPRALGDRQHDWVFHPAIYAVAKLPRDTPCRFLCDDHILVRDLARDGNGVAMLPRFMAEPYVREGLLEQVTVPTFAGPRAGLYLVYPSSAKVPRRVSAFRDFIVAHLKKSPLA